MRARSVLQASPEPDLGKAIDRLCDPALPPDERQRVRGLVTDTLGLWSDAVLRACAGAAAARSAAKALEDELEKQRRSAQLCGIVLGVAGERARVLVAGTERLLLRDGLAVGVGQQVVVDADGRRLVGANGYLVGGQTVAMCERLDGRWVLVQPLRESPDADARVTALVSDAVDVATLRAGDRLLAWMLDGGNVLLVTRRLGALRPAAADDGPLRDVADADLVGLDAIIDRLERLLLRPASPAYAPLVAQAGRGVVGAVLQGPPGCGKTLAADWLASRVRAGGGKTLYRTASSYLSKWVGEGAAILRADVALLEAAFEESGERPLLVIDELEAIALDRSHGWTLRGGHLDVLDTLLSLLTRTPVRVVGISNVADRFLDAALVRAGRLPVIVFPSTLDAGQVATLVARSLGDVALDADGVPPGDRPRAFGDAVSDVVFGAELAELLRVQLADGRELTFGARDLVTGASVNDGIVRPLFAAIAHRDQRAGLPAPRPLARDELCAATVAYFVERCASLTRDNVRAAVPGRIPEDQTIAAVTRIGAAAGAA